MNDVTSSQERQPEIGAESIRGTSSVKTPSEKNYVVAVCLSGVFGVVGVHHFYLGRYLEGIFDFSMFCLTIYFYATGQIGWALLFFAVDFMHTLVVTIMLLTGSFKDGRGKIICYPGQKLN